MPGKKKKPELIEKDFAKLVKGKMAISFEGWERLRHLREIRELRRSRTVKAAKPTKLRKKVLFACPGGVESSFVGMKEFREIAGKKPVQANLALDYAGWMQRPVGDAKKIFAKEVLSADFVVPMGPNVAERVQRIIGKSKHGPKIIDPKFMTISDQYDAARYELVLEEIRKSLKKAKGG